MSFLHPLRIGQGDHRPAEEVSPDFHIEKLLWARRQSWLVFSELRDQLQEGMTEVELNQRVKEIFLDHGVRKHWHKPYVRIGPQTRLTFHDPVDKEYRLQENDAVYFDFGPVWKDSESGLEYEGDVGDTFAFGSNPSSDLCAQAAREIFSAGENLWVQEQATGEKIYARMQEMASQMGYRFTENVLGHRLSDFPHKKYTREGLAHVDFFPNPGLWVLELHIYDEKNQVGAFFEDMLGVQREQ